VARWLKDDGVLRLRGNTGDDSVVDSCEGGSRDGYEQDENLKDEMKS